MALETTERTDICPCGKGTCTVTEKRYEMSGKLFGNPVAIMNCNECKDIYEYNIVRQCKENYLESEYEWIRKENK